jgi:hypothetical protein
MPNYIGPKEIDEWKKEIPFDIQNYLLRQNGLPQMKS